MSTLQFSGREKNIFFLFLVVCGIYGVYAGIYRPAVVKGQEIESDIDQASTRLAEQAKVIRRARAMAARFDGDLQSVRQKTSNEEEMSLILSEIEAAAGGLKVRVTEMKPQGTQKEDFYNKFSVSLTVDGNLTDILQFIHTLQGSSHRLTVSQFSLERAFQNTKEMLSKLVVNRILIPY